jgi:serine/threonine protein kinase
VTGPAGYEILDVLGRGAMGVVYRARQQHLGREVALKMIALTESACESYAARLEREAAALAKLSHPHLVKVLDAGNFDGQPFLAMELVRGVRLEDYALSDPVTMRRRADELFHQMVSAVAELHRHNLIHRDLKPQNVMIDEQGRAVVMDLGLVKDTSGDGSCLTKTGALLGTPIYLAPEVFDGEIADERADVWSLACMYYFLHAAHPPFRSMSLTELVRMITVGPLPDLERDLPELAPERRAVLEKMFTRAPADRPRDARAVLALLEGRPDLRSGKNPRPRARTAPVSNPPSVPPRRIKMRTLVLIASAAIATAGAALVAMYSSVRGRSDLTARPSASTEAERSTVEDARALIDSLERLRPAQRLDDLRTLEDSMRKSRLGGDERTKFLAARWREQFAPIVQESRLAEAAARLSPANAQRSWGELDPPTRLVMMNLIEDLGFLCLGLERLGLPGPLPRSPATVRSPLLSDRPPLRYDGAVGFELPRKAGAKPVRLVPHPDSGAIGMPHLVKSTPKKRVDDFFSIHIVAMGSHTEAQSIFEGFDNAEAGRFAQTSYTHTQALEIPPPATLAAAAFSTFVTALDAEQRFEIYVAGEPDGPFVRRAATFRDDFDGTRQLWHAIDPALLPGPKVYVRVQFSVLPGMASNFDDAELHQLLLHYKRRAR